LIQVPKAIKKSIQEYGEGKEVENQPATLIYVLNSPHICLVGNNISRDNSKIDDLGGLVDGRICKCEDLGTISCRLGVLQLHKGYSLQGLVKMLLTKHLNKDNSNQLSNWNQDILKDNQIKYVMIDAVAGLNVGASLEQKEAIYPIPAGHHRSFLTCVEPTQ
jgi:hypothetical protein